MTCFTIYRPTEAFNKRFSYDLHINEVMHGSLANGEVKSVQLDTAMPTLTIQASLLWCGSKKLTVQHPHPSLKIKVTGNKFLNHTLPHLGALFPISGMLLFTDWWPALKPLGLSFFSLMLLGLLGTLTLGRNLWLRVEVEEDSAFHPQSEEIPLESKETAS